MRGTGERKTEKKEYAVRQGWVVQDAEEMENQKCEAHELPKKM